MNQPHPPKHDVVPRSEDTVMEDATSTFIQNESVEQDPFLAFIDYAKSVLAPAEDEVDGDDEVQQSSGPGWSWIASRILKTCISYSSGVTAAILLSDLAQGWSEQNRSGATKKRPECIDRLKKKHRRAKLLNTVTIDSIYEKNFLSLSSVLEAVVVDAFLLPGTNIYMLTLGDYWSSNTIEIYLHRRYYDLLASENGILKKGREIFLTGCYLRTAVEGLGHHRLLPTEYLVVILDEDQDDDAMLLAAQFCSDSFSSISLDAVRQGASYSFYARIESIGSLEVQGKFGCLKRKQITLVDHDGAKLQFYLWGEQIVLANLLSVGSMLALDGPFISCSSDNDMESCEEICLEFGSTTLLYLVPLIEHEEQISVALTQNRYQGSRLMTPTQCPKVSQVTLRCDLQGSIDFSNYPFRCNVKTYRKFLIASFSDKPAMTTFGIFVPSPGFKVLQSFVTDLCDKMTGVSLYGVVIDVIREQNSKEVIFSIKIKDCTGAAWARLRFAGLWSLGWLGLGHTVFVSGLTCSTTRNKNFEVHWFESDVGASFINLSCLPAFLSSPCIHKSSSLSNLSRQTGNTHVCRVWLDQIDHCQVETRFSHTLCGHFVDEHPDGNFTCNFCQKLCETEVIRSFYLKIPLADKSAKIFAWCFGNTAAELLQISPDDFYNLPEEEQFMYPSSLENEKFIVAIVNSGREDSRDGDRSLMSDSNAVVWEITRALKYDWF